MHRCACIVFIPTWLLLGLATAGYLWPLQVRECLFVARGEEEHDTLPKDEGERNITEEMLHEEILAASQTTNTKIGAINSDTVQLKSDMIDVKEMLINIQAMMGNFALTPQKSG
jgi:hypothetical protein